MVPVGVQHSPQNPGQTHAAHVNAIEAGHDSRAVGAPALFLRAATPRAVGPRRPRGTRGVNERGVMANFACRAVTIFIELESRHS